MLSLFSPSTGIWGNTLKGSTSAFHSKETWNTLWTLANCEGKFISYAMGPIRFKISNGPMNLEANFLFMSNLNMCFHGATFRNTLSPRQNSRGLLRISAYLFYLSWATFIWSLMILTLSVVICTNFALYNFLSPTSS